MPKKAKELTAMAVAKLKSDGRYMVGGVDGLHIRIAGPSKSWIARLVVQTRTEDGKVQKRRRDIGLGAYPEISLADAREAARMERSKVRGGIDPVAERQRQRAEVREAARIEKAYATTFEECTIAYMADQSGKWKNANAKHVKQWATTLETYAYPIFGKRSVASIDTDAVLKVLQQPTVDKDGETKTLWEAKTETASRVRGRIESVLGWAKAKKLREGENPAAWKDNLAPILPPPGDIKRVEHQPSLPYTRIGTFMAELRKRQGMDAKALQFLILTAVRSGAVLGAKWSEFDLNARLWTIPKDRMKGTAKNRREHIVPLSDAAIAVLEAAKAMPRIGTSEFVFPAAKGGAMTDMALSMLVRRMNGDKPKFVDKHGEPIVPHGFRATIRTWMADNGYNHELAENVLSHTIKNKVEAAYQRETMLPQRIPVMTEWAKFVAIVPTTGASVVAFPEAAAS